MATFVLIGGGEIGSKETLKIDERIVKLTNKKVPNFLFIPTASNEAEGYINVVKSIYSEILSCNFDWLSLENGKIETELEKIKWADIIYVGGGNTKKMIAKWKEFKVDVELKKYLKTDKIYCGLSAGSICWFEQGISDSESFENTDVWNYSIIDGLGFIEGCNSPHYDDRVKEESFNRFVKNLNINILAIENNCAVVVGKTIEIIRSHNDKNAYYIFSNGTQQLSAHNSLNFSLGVFIPKVLRGRSFNNRVIRETCD